MIGNGGRKSRSEKGANQNGDWNTNGTTSGTTSGTTIGGIAKWISNLEKGVNRYDLK
jgi:hypothetical protein